MAGRAALRARWDAATPLRSLETVQALPLSDRTVYRLGRLLITSVQLFDVGLVGCVAAGGEGGILTSRDCAACSASTRELPCSALCLRHHAYRAKGALPAATPDAGSDTEASSVNSELVSLGLPSSFGRKVRTLVARLLQHPCSEPTSNAPWHPWHCSQDGKHGNTGADRSRLATGSGPAGLQLQRCLHRLPDLHCIAAIASLACVASEGILSLARRRQAEPEGEGCYWQARDGTGRQRGRRRRRRLSSLALGPGLGRAVEPLLLLQRTDAGRCWLQLPC
jgi:hypothetical protein